MTAIDSAKALVFTGGAIPTTGATSGDLAAETTAREAADNFGDTIRMTNIAGTGDAVTADVPAEQAHIAMTVGQYIDIRWPANNTAADPTATIGGVAFVVRRRDGGALVADDLRADAVYRMRVQATGASPRLRVQNAVAAGDINGLGSAATTDATDYATAAEGAKADTAVQPGDDVSVLAETATAKIMTGDERAYLAGVPAMLSSEASARADADVSLRYIGSTGEAFEATRSDADMIVIDPAGRLVSVRPAGFLYEEAARLQSFETTRDDIDRLTLDRDGRAAEIVQWARRAERFETTRDLDRIGIDLAGREIPVRYDAATEPAFGAWALREFRMRSRAIMSGLSMQAVVAIVGDSYTQKYDRYVGRVTEALWDQVGFAGLGYQSFGWFGGAGGPWVVGGTQPVGSDSGPTHGSPWCQTEYSGAWSTLYNSTASGMPSLSRTTSATAGDYLRISVTKSGHDAARLHYYGVDDAVIEVSWDDGANWGAPITLTGTGAQVVALTGVPSGTFTARVRVVSGTVSLGGIDWRSAASGVRVHRLGGSGSQAAQWAVAAAGWDTAMADLAPNSLIVAHGTNDQTVGVSPVAFATSVERIARRVAGVLPACDLMVTTPPENNRTTNAVAMTAYAAEQRRRAVAAGWAHLDYQQFFGPPDNYGAAYAAANASRPWFNADLTHPEPAYPVMADALMRFIMSN